MSFVAELEIALHLHSFKTILFKNQGLVRFRLSLFHKLNNNQSRSISCVPVQIIGKPSDKQWLPSLISKEDNSYHSQAVPVMPSRQDYIFDEICIFKADIPMQKMEEVELICNAELFFSSEAILSDYNEFESLAFFDAKISKVSKISEYMCITFDDFQGFKVNASYSATILQFKFIENKNSVYGTFAQYVEASTEGFLKRQTKTFYSFYKRAIQKIDGIMNTHGSLIYGSIPIKKSKIMPIQNSKVDFQIQKLSNQQTHISNPLVRRIVDLILEDLAIMRNQNSQLWRRYVGLILQNSSKIISLGRSYFEKASKERLKFHVFSHEIKSFDPTESKYEDVGKQHLQQAANQKKKFIKQASPLHFNIQNIKYYPIETKAPKIFQEIYYTGRKPLIQRTNHNCLHVFVLVHGFQATRKDMELFRVMLQTSVENCQIMVSCYNQNKTESSIQKLGNNLAGEVINYLTSLGKIEYKLSFIGHSMGGVIIRASLQYLSQFYSKFWTFVSLSSPHLGYLAHSSQLVNAGLWYLNTWEKCESISQLAMVDNTQLQNTFLYKLSKDQNMKYFHNVALVSSYQDSYVSFESARVQKTSRIIENALKKDKKQILNNLVAKQYVKWGKVQQIVFIVLNFLEQTLYSTFNRSTFCIMKQSGFINRKDSPRETIIRQRVCQNTNPCVLAYIQMIMNE